MAERKLTLLLLSAGRRVALLECFRGDARALGVDLRVLAVDMLPDLSAACSVADAAFAAPKCTLPEFAPFLLDLCHREGVDIVVPTIDTELPALARLAAPLASQGTRAIISSERIVSLAHDKLRTAEVLAQSGIPTPRTTDLDRLDPRDSGWVWPLLAKPKGGSSSVGVRTLAAPELASLPPGSDLIVQERLVGEEHTVNMFFDMRGQLRAVVPHLRIETRAGEVSKAETVRDPQLTDIGWRLGAILQGARGALCFQTMRRATGEPVVFEINARFGGGYPIAHRAGACFSKWLLEETADLPSSANDDWKSGVRMLRYDAAVFK